jgi:hypothetical protein
LDLKLYLDAFLKEKKKSYFVIPNARIYPMDIRDGGYLSILKSDIRLIYFCISLHAITSENIKKIIITRTDG